MGHHTIRPISPIFHSIGLKIRCLTFNRGPLDSRVHRTFYPVLVRLILLRHGQTSSNINGALDTAAPGAALSELGQAQARAAARALGPRGIDAIFVSNLLRTHETAAPLAGLLGISPAQYDGLREITAGHYEMATDADSVHGYLGTILNWIGGEHHHQMAGGETGHQFLDRYDAAIDQVVRSGSREALVVSHGAAIRAWVASRAQGAESDEWVEHALTPLHNTGAIELELVRNTWEIVAWDNEPIGGAYLEDADAPDPTAG